MKKILCVLAVAAFPFQAAAEAAEIKSCSQSELDSLEFKNQQLGAKAKVPMDNTMEGQFYQVQGALEIATANMAQGQKDLCVEHLQEASDLLDKIETEINGG